MTIDKQALRADAVRAGGVKWQYMRATQHSKAYITDETGSTVINCTDGDVPAKCVGFLTSANPATVLALLDELETLHPFHTAFTEWHDKTEWVQTDKRFEEIKPWGKHRSDVLREFIEHLESKLVAAESGFPTLTVERLMREKESLEERVAELEEIATDYAVQFMRSQDALKHQALLHKSQMEVAEKQVEELTMFVKRLSYSLRNARPDSKLHSDAMDYLSRKGLISVEDVLR